MIARITPAVRISGPFGFPLNSAPITGILPIVFWRNGSIVVSMTGFKTNSPHSP